MQERIFRFSTTGIIFVLASIFGFWFVGGNLNELIGDKNEKVIAAIILIKPTPAEGFIKIQAKKALKEANDFEKKILIQKKFKSV